MNSVFLLDNNFDMNKIVSCNNLSKDYVAKICPDVVELIKISSTELFDTIFGSKVDSIIKSLFLSKGNLYSYQNTCVNLDDSYEENKVMGAIVFFPKEKMINQGLKMGFKILFSIGLKFIFNLPALLKAQSLLLPIPRKSIYISNLAVFPEFRGKGVGKALIEYVIFYAKSKGYEKVLLDVGVENKTAMNLYEKLGFKIVAKTNLVKIKNYNFCFYRMERTLF